MRPLSLRLEGFTCYKQPAEVSFEGLDLFAITGPTGSGKSSIVDGITYALYGRVPRLGNEVRSLISLGSERLQAAFEFAVNGGRYRVVRSTGRKGAGHVQLFHFDITTEDWEGLEDRANAVAQRVRDILGLDYDGFIRSVLLPQGQFHLFLAGEPKERREVLSELLRLDVYDRIMQAANSRARTAEAQATALARRLEEDYAGATPQTLRAAKQALKAREEERQRLEIQRTNLETGRQAAATLSTAARGRADAAANLESAASVLEEAESMLRGGESRLEELEARLTSVQEEIEATSYDPKDHERLRLALTPARELEQADSRLKSLEPLLVEGQRAKIAAEKSAEVSRRRLKDASAALEKAETFLENVRKREAASRLRSELTAGEACPVCGQNVPRVPAVEHLALDEAKQERDRATETQARASEALSKAEQDIVRQEARVDSIEGDQKKAQDERERWRRELIKLLDSKVPVDSAAISRQIREQEAARKRSQELSRLRDGIRKEQDSYRREFQAAEAKAAGAREAVALHQKAIQRLEEEVRAGERSLTTLASRYGWDDILDALKNDGDPAKRIEVRHSTVSSELASVDRSIGAVRADIDRIEKGIEQAKTLRAEHKTLLSSADTTKQLANLLRADRFQAFVQRAALEILAEDASRHLRLISDNRYELRLEEAPEGRASTFRRESQEFAVIDHWGDQESRSVKTLSGGETFLASLSLALALAERLPDLGAAMRPTSLDSLFMDEGFGTLDDDSLEAVADALDRLHLGDNGSGTSGRTVGIITHRRELADRMPAQIQVIKSPDGSTIVTA